MSSVPIIQAVVVLYRCSPEDSITIQTLRQCLLTSPTKLAVLIYDNSPDPWQGHLEENWSYHHDPSNGGIVAAYNMAFNLATSGAEWLLLLDQDSCLSEDFVIETFRAIKVCAADQRVAIIAPKVFSHGRLISPSRVMVGRYIREYNSGLMLYEITALNAGSVVRIASLNALNGFCKEFRLDFLDYWLYHSMYKLGSCTYIGLSTLQHNLSVSDYNRSVSYERYLSIISSEEHFINMYQPRYERLLYVFRLAIRTLKQLAVVKDRRIPKLTARFTLIQIRTLIGYQSY